MRQSRSTSVKLLGLGTVVAVQLALGVIVAPAANAAVSPVTTPSSTQVSVDALPTVQIDGVVWSQTMVGNTVFAGGQFGKARPAGAAPGVNTSTRTNLVSFDVTDGKMTSFAPTINAQVKAVTAAPNGTRVYIGGSFTSVNGVKRNRIAAFDLINGAWQLSAAFAPSVDSTVNAIAVSPDSNTVYAGGVFNAVGGQTRSKLAAFSAGGSLLGWTANADGTVNALAVTAGGTQLIAGGAFKNVSSKANYGMAALNASTGAVLPWLATNVVRDAGPDAAILGLEADANTNRVYGNGYVFGSGGNLEGAFAADGTTGKIIWIEDCHGDTYDTFPMGGALYTVSHAHFCKNLGGFPESVPRSTNMRHALAFTTNVTGTIVKNTGGSSYFNFEGQPSPSLVNWFPDLVNGSYTGKTQAAWSITGNADYIVLGGEFPKVNNVNQQGLVRFQVRTKAPSKMGPRVSGANFVPTLTSVSNGVKVSWQSNFDNDDLTLTYQVVRDATLTNQVTLTQLTANSTFWNRPTLTYTDTTAAAGSTHKYRIVAVDPSSNKATGADVSITRPTAAAAVAPLAAADAAPKAAPNAANAVPNAAPDPATDNKAVGAAEVPAAPAQELAQKPVDPAAQPVAAQFVTSVAGRTVEVDGTSGPAAADGVVRTYSWDFGDGSTGTGSTTSHTYAADGSYTVALTVTDGEHSATPLPQSVTVAAPPVENPN